MSTFSFGNHGGGYELQHPAPPAKGCGVARAALQIDCHAPSESIIAHGRERNQVIVSRESEHGLPTLRATDGKPMATAGGGVRERGPAVRAALHVKSLAQGSACATKRATPSDVPLRALRKCPMI